MRARLCVFGVLLLLSAALLEAQSGAIRGTVRDVSGGALPGVIVDASGPALGESRRSTVTDARGAYQLLDLPVGTYTLTFSLPGFTTLRREHVILMTGVTAAVDADLHLGEIAETVIVAAEAPTVDVTQARQATVLTGEDVRDLPTSRNLSGRALRGRAGRCSDYRLG